MPPELIPALVTGGLIVAVGVGLWLVRGPVPASAATTPDELRAANASGRQRRRRTQISATLILLGLALPTGVGVPMFKAGVLAVAFWGGVLLLTMWVVLLALGDFAATAVRTRSELNRLKQQRTQLEAELARRKSVQQNGHAGP